MKNEVNAILAKHFLCVISTVTETNQPEGAIVGYVHNDDLELLIGTSHKTRKYANVAQNPYVAITVGDTEAEIQYEGTVRLLDREEVSQHIGTRFEKLPGIPKYQDDPDERWLLVTPTWLRLTVHGDQDRVEELREFA